MSIIKNKKDFIIIIKYVKIYLSFEFINLSGDIMHFKVDELLLLENLTYLDNIPPLYELSKFSGKTIKEVLDELDLSKLDDEKEYASFMPGIDWRLMLNAISKNNRLLNTKVVDSHHDQAFGGGLGFSVVFISEELNEVVVAYRGTAAAEWTDDFLGANQIDSLQQINALEWFKIVYEQYNFKDYYLTVTGHSKGGNKAKYVTILNNHVNRCVSFDGQGFSDKFMDYYKKEIRLRSEFIENHNIDFDYVNILMNDIGNKTFYKGFDYRSGGFAEAHCPNKFFNFINDYEYKMEVNPDGQRPEMVVLKNFINSMIRSAESDKDRSKNNKLVGDLVEKAFGIDQSISSTDFLTYLIDQLGDNEYIDNVAYLIAFTIKYSRGNANLLDAFRGIMSYFGADGVVNTINMIEDFLNPKKLKFLLGVSNFLIVHANKIVVKKIQSIAKKKYDIELTKEQIQKVLMVVSIVKEKLNTLEVDFNGSDIVLENNNIEEESLLDNLNIVILAGGLSLERNISLYSGYMLYQELKNQGHNVILLDSYMGYSDEEKDIDDCFSDPDKYSMDVGEITDDIPDLWAVRKRRIYQTNSYFGPNVLKICNQSDLVFIALNGKDGENGKLQSTFDLLGIDYTGNNYLSSNKSSNKILSKSLLKENNIPTPNGYYLKKNQNIIYPKDKNINYPVIIKTNSLGFGIGVSAVKNDQEFINALDLVFKWDDEAIIEEYIIGREFSVSTLNYEVMPVLESLPLNTKDDKVGMNLVGIKSKRCPAEIDKKLSDKLQEYALKASKLLDLKAYSKNDFLVKESGEIYCTKCDSSPSLSKYSHFSQACLEANINYSNLVNRIIELSLDKNK